ncbi:MAG: retroviral-like aspartic protease family protein [Chloroflexi bacterium]|nr:retroviral-like aspartic protease family protein [Chloroflexota bacterium]MBI3742557.1 retroviral-like aspartic protease family protein [Chloroflexota bacterium]
MKIPYDTSFIPPAPFLEIQLGAPDAAFAIGPVRAFVDTGADVSIVPLRYLEPLYLQADNRKFLRSSWGERRLVDVYFLDVAVGNRRLPLVEIIADERGDEMILGRNLLNKLMLILNGPNLILELDV